MSGTKLLRAASVLSSFAAFLAASPAQSADYYVSPLGSDGATGALAAPFRTLSRGVAAAMPGDTVYIRGGRYVGWANQLNPIRAGRADAWITFRAYPGELPVLLPPSDAAEASAFEPFDDPEDEFDDVPISFIVVEGLVAYQWPTSGFSNGWDKHATNIEVRHCIADGNGVNGLTFYDASGVLFEHNIAAHNGNRAPSYSSGVNLYGVTGGVGVNIVRGNVSFENIDICGASGCNASQSTDGNGFILDEGGQGVLFESNLAFRNGGSCLRMTLTPGAQLINNTCYGNGLDTGYSFAFGEIFFSDQGSRDNIVVRNNIAVGSNGQPVINDTTGMNASVANNAFAPTAAAVFRDPSGENPDFRLSQSGQSLLNTADGSATGSTDLGFDPGCIVRASAPVQGVAFWQYAVNYSYIQSIGGVAGCFRTAARSVGGGADMGAYEAVGGTGCQFHSDCADTDVCTRDVCSDAGVCSSAAIEGCCSADADCQDASACTTNTCNVASHRCETAPVPACCASAADCDDDSTCTTDACDSAGNCSNTANATCANADGTATPPLVNVPVQNPALDTGSPAAGAGGQNNAGAAGAPTGASAAGGAPAVESEGTAGGGAAAVPGAVPATSSGSSGSCAVGAPRAAPSSAAWTSLLALGAFAVLGRSRRLRKRNLRTTLGVVLRALSAFFTLGSFTLGCGSDEGATQNSDGVPMFGAGGTSTSGPNDMTSGSMTSNGGTAGATPMTNEVMPNPMLPAGTGGTGPAPMLNTPAPVEGTGPPSGPAQACAGTLAAEDGLVIDFGTYDLATGAWGNDVRAQLTGGTSAYSCADDGSCPPAAVLALSPTEAGGMRFAAQLPPGGYAGAVLWFGPCIDASAFEGIQFLASGSLGGGEMLFKVQTNGNYPVDTANSKGACEYEHESSKWSECVPPEVRLTSLLAEPGLVALPWNRFVNGLPTAGVTPRGLVGIELQFQCRAGATCAIDIAIGTVLFQSPPFAL